MSAIEIGDFFKVSDRFGRGFWCRLIVFGPSSREFVTATACPNKIEGYLLSKKCPIFWRESVLCLRQQCCR